jgi:hypothetical protein
MISRLKWLRKLQQLKAHKDIEGLYLALTIKSGKCEFAAFFVPENKPNIADN